jgi:ParB-like nuclease domain
MTLRPLKALITAQQAAPAPGAPAELTWLPIDKLVVDDRYQRVIARTGTPNVLRILSQFDWRKFTPVVVTPVEGGLWAIIDGQHRATAALMHPAITAVPCMVIEVTPQEAADCFAAINGQVTRITLAQLWKARVMAADPAALAVQAVLAAADVRVMAYKTPTNVYAPGDTLALGTIERLVRVHGSSVVITALQAITQTGTGNAGCLTAPLIAALCDLVAATPRWQRAPTQLFALIDEIDLADLIAATGADAKRQRKPQLGLLKARLLAHFGEQSQEADRDAA